MANTAYSPRQPATVGLDGIVYLLEVYETEFFINAISVGENIYCKKASKDHTASVCRNSSLVENETVTRDAQNVTVSRSSAASRALSMINYNWTFSNGHNRWAEYSATAPAYLASASVPSAQTGIPYAWGRFNGYTNLGGNNASFSAAAAIVDPYDSSKRLYAAGNCVAAGVTNNKAIGLDCSGYASSAYGFTEKAGTYHFATSAYFTTIQSNNLMRMDALVKSGSHMEFFVTVTNSAAGTIQVYECCTANGKTVINYPNLGTLTGSGYVCRRPTSWANCVHTNVNPTYLYDSVNHWKKCKFCEGAVNVTPHTFVYVGSNYQCSVCGYISGTTPRDLDTIEESH